MAPSSLRASLDAVYNGSSLCHWDRHRSKISITPFKRSSPWFFFDSEWPSTGPHFYGYHVSMTSRRTQRSRFILQKVSRRMQRTDSLHSLRLTSHCCGLQRFIAVHLYNVLSEFNSFFPVIYDKSVDVLDLPDTPLQTGPQGQTITSYWCCL